MAGFVSWLGSHWRLYKARYLEEIGNDEIKGEMLQVLSMCSPSNWKLKQSCKIPSHRHGVILLVP